MAFTQLVAQANRSGPPATAALNAPDGTLGVSPPVTLPAGTRLVTFRLTSSTWPAGTGDYVLFGMDVSDNGSPWRLLAPPERIDEGALGRGGLLPQITWDVSRQVPALVGTVQLRARYAVPQGTVRFGLEWEALP